MPELGSGPVWHGDVVDMLGERDRTQCFVTIDAKWDGGSFENVHFDTESAVLDATAKRKLDAVATVLERNPDVVVEISGHADSRGPEDYNMRLSVNRAESVSRYLAQQGVDASRMAVRGFGESRPVASNDTASGQAQNRRVELQATGR